MSEPKKTYEEIEQELAELEQVVRAVAHDIRYSRSLDAELSKMTAKDALEAAARDMWTCGIIMDTHNARH